MADSELDPEDISSNPPIPAGPGVRLDPGLEGRWVGFVENPFRRDEEGQVVPAAFPSGSTAVTLDYRFDGVLFLPAATLIFGAGPAPQPERGVPYPRGVHHYYGTTLRTSFDAPVVEGYPYELTETEHRFSGYDPGTASLLTFTQLAPFEEWCALQPSLPVPGGEFDCTGLTGYGGGDPIAGIPCHALYSDGSTGDFDCDFAEMCFSDLCRCTADGCEFNRSETLGQLFLEREGDEMVGTISGATLESGRPGWYTPMGTLRLQRVVE